MQEVVTPVSRRGDPQKSQTVPNWERAPWLEQYYNSQVVGASQGPRLLTTHLPYSFLGNALHFSIFIITALRQCDVFSTTVSQQIFDGFKAAFTQNPVLRMSKIFVVHFTCFTGLATSLFFKPNKVQDDINL